MEGYVWLKSAPITQAFLSMAASGTFTMTGANALPASGLSRSIALPAQLAGPSAMTASVWANPSRAISH